MSSACRRATVVLRHLRVAQWPIDVGGAAVALQLNRDDASCSGQAGQQRRETALDRAHRTVQKHHGEAGTVNLVVHLQAVHRNVPGHERRGIDALGHTCPQVASLVLGAAIAGGLCWQRIFRPMADHMATLPSSLVSRWKVIHRNLASGVMNSGDRSCWFVAQDGDTGLEGLGFHELQLGLGIAAVWEEASSSA
jgi:hypothetical protein